ncbi:hypothetical protein GCM10023205_69910 [Yinghuangia aomiensis]|uniref:Uncharacterized protein n=1 Tax=Yinghuangia aomiensis TaxID=676205 RepID=A0ABP9I6Z7_9ACTN
MRIGSYTPGRSIALPVRASAQNARMSRTVSRMCATGFPKRARCQSSLSRRTPLPSPRTNRPPEISSRSSASSAVTSGLRVNASAIPVPSRADSVAWANAATGTVALRYSSGTHTTSAPARSARRAASASSSIVSPHGP